MTKRDDYYTWLAEQKNKPRTLLTGLVPNARPVAPADPNKASAAGIIAAYRKALNEEPEEGEDADEEESEQAKKKKKRRRRPSSPKTTKSSPTKTTPLREAPAPLFAPIAAL